MGDTYKTKVIIFVGVCSLLVELFISMFHLRVLFFSLLLEH